MPVIPRGERHPIVSKPTFVEILKKVLIEKQGVVFKDGKKVSAATEKYWQLYCLIKDVEVAAAAASGTSVSLAGVGKLQFKEAGRTEESRCFRFKSSISSKYTKFFAENQDLVAHGDQASEEVIANALKIIDILNPVKVADGGAEAIEDVEVAPAEAETAEAEEELEIDDDEL